MTENSSYRLEEECLDAAAEFFQTRVKERPWLKTQQKSKEQLNVEIKDDRIK